MRGDGGVEPADEVRVCRALGPLHPQGPGLPAELIQRSLVRRGLDAEDPRARLEHRARGGQAGQERHLCVVLLDRRRHAIADAPPGALPDDLLLGNREPDAAPVPFDPQPPLADLGHQLSQRGRHVLVGVLRDAPDEPALDQAEASPPSPSRSSVQSAAARHCPGSSEAAPSERTTG